MKYLIKPIVTFLVGFLLVAGTAVALPTKHHQPPQPSPDMEMIEHGPMHHHHDADMPLSLLPVKACYVPAMKAYVLVDSIDCAADLLVREDGEVRRVGRFVTDVFKGRHDLKNILRLAPDFALVRSLGALAILSGSGIPLHGDYSLNAANSLSYEWLLGQGLDMLHPSWDLNSTQLFDLLDHIDASRLELALHQYMPAFHSEYCAFARALTDGRRFPECGKICTLHKVEILDHKGEKHFLQSDAECRNTLFVGKPQSALKLYPRLTAAGVRNFRIELLDESPETARRKVQTYVAAIRGNISIDAAIAQAGVEEKYGLSEGQLFNESTWIDRKKGNCPE